MSFFDSIRNCYSLISIMISMSNTFHKSLFKMLYNVTPLKFKTVLSHFKQYYICDFYIENF